MTSNRRILASQANGARSKGPETPEGKRRSSQNALKHGLLSDRIVLESESPEAFQTLLDRHTDRFAPKDDVELGFIEEMAASSWRLRRLWAIETSLLDDAFAADPEGDGTASIGTAFSRLAEGPGLALLHRYETRLHMMYQRALRNILVLRSTEMPNETPKTMIVRWVDPGDKDYGDPASPPPHPQAPTRDPEPPAPDDHPPAPDIRDLASVPTAAVRNEPNPTSGQLVPVPGAPVYVTPSQVPNYPEPHTGATPDKPIGVPDQPVPDQPKDKLLIPLPIAPVPASPSQLQPNPDLPKIGSVPPFPSEACPSHLTPSPEGAKNLAA